MIQIDVHSYYRDRSLWERAKFYVIGVFIVTLLILAFLVAAAHAEEGTASWYSYASCLREGTSGITASGERLNDEKYTCASWFFPFGTRLMVVNLDTGKSVVVTVNDRGPSKRLVRRGRIIDLSKAAFEKICPLKKGIVRVSVEVCHG